MSERQYRIAKAAELSGVSEPLIRAWERRYGVVAPTRTAGGYRVYTDDDVAVLRELKRLTDEGIAIAQAAERVPGLRDRLAVPAPPRTDASALEQWRAALFDAAGRMDQAEIDAVLDQVLSALSPLHAVEQFLLPVEQEVGERWHAGTLSVAQEHLVTQAIRARLIRLVHGRAGDDRFHVICACFPEETHELGLLGAAFRFQERGGARVTVLGQRTPPAQLGELVRALKPDLVALSAVQDDGEAAFTRALSEVVGAVGGACPILIGGRTAEKYRAIATERGVRIYSGEDDWRGAPLRR